MNKNKLIILLSLLLFSQLSSANLIVDTKGVNMDQYNIDLLECQQLSTQVQEEQTKGVGRSVVGTAARGAALGAAGTAIAGGHGSDGAKIGAGIGVVGGLLHHRHAVAYNQAQYEEGVNNVQKQCMVGRGYKVLN
ncbi:glycine zipper family protein [Vibrio chagasii]|uniref:glycine zipper family protein n=1 Tax=Vibrio chagasii TaxID=170679 RepID=UPI003735F534